MEKYKICPSCGKHNTTKAIECRFCEMSLANVKPTDDETEALRADAEEKKVEDRAEDTFAAPLFHSGQMARVCSECGAHNLPNARKCVACGEDISDVIPTEETAPEPLYVCKYMLQSYVGDYVFEIPEEGCVVGREHAMNDFLRDKSYVSRQHAAFSVEDDRLFIENLSKTNYTYVNNIKIVDKTEIKAGDEIGLGGNITSGQRQEQAAYFIVKRD